MSEVGAVAESRFTILTVCTGNICRSPLAEHLLRTGLRRLPSVQIGSAGTGALVGRPMTDQTIAIAHEHGVSGAEEHRARALNVDQVRDADLVIALTRAHRAEIVSMLPRASRRIFTLREFARLLDAIQEADLDVIAAHAPEDTVGRLAELVDSAASLRGFVAPPVNELDDDVVDPYRRDDSVYREAEAQLVPAVSTILRHFESAANATAVEV
jgi:protein-tyrosine phosphatase